MNEVYLYRAHFVRKFVDSSDHRLHSLPSCSAVVEFIPVETLRRLLGMKPAWLANTGYSRPTFDSFGDMKESIDRCEDEIRLLALCHGDGSKTKRCSAARTSRS